MGQYVHEGYLRNSCFYDSRFLKDPNHVMRKQRFIFNTQRTRSRLGTFTFNAFGRAKKGVQQLDARLCT